MTAFEDRYAHIIIEDFLKLQKGDLLSINVEDSDMAFARTVANLATEKTENLVKIVITQNHRPYDYIEFEPQVPSTDVKAYAMLHIEHVKQIQTSENVIDVSVDKDDFPAIQKLGHLAEPAISGRRISVVWCCAAVYDSDDPRWAELEKKLTPNVNALIEKCDYRKHFIEHSDVRKVHISSENSSFTVTVFDDGNVICGSSVLSNGRKFISSADFTKAILGCEKDSLQGSFFASGTCLGKKFEGEFIFKDGSLVSYPEISQLTEFFSFDSNCSKAGYISLEDKNFHLYLGGSLVDALDLENRENSELPPWFNSSYYTLDLKLEDRMEIEFENCSGEKKKFAIKGMLLE